MDRVTLPKIIHKVELLDEPEIIRRGSIPAGLTLPAWDQIPLDAKFPMIPAPKGSVVLATTDLCKPKHCATREHDFDLTDPNAFVMSNDYSALHDPHLKAHFGTFFMRRHLIQNGFLTPEGQVVCSLVEFNEYRRYLRKLCLMELAREKRQKERGSLARSSVDDNTEESERLAIIDLRARIREQEEAQRQKFLARQVADDQRMEQRQLELEEKQTEKGTIRRENDDRRRQIISDIQQSERSRNEQLLQKWEAEERKRLERIEKLKKQKAISLHRKLLSKWNERRKYQEKRLAKEAERMEQVGREKLLRVENRKSKVKQQWRKQEESLNNMRSESALKRKASNERYEKKMSRIMAIYTLSDTGHRSRRQSPYRSLWVLERVLKRLHFPDIKSDMSKADQIQQDELWNLVNGIIDNAVETLKLEGTERELQILQQGAQAVVQWTLEKIMMDNVTDIIKCADEDPADGRGDDGSEGHDKGSFKKEVLSCSSPSEQTVKSKSLSEADVIQDTTVEFTTLVDAASDTISGEDRSETPSASITKIVPTAAHLELMGKSLTVLRHSFMRLEQNLPEDTVMETKQALSNLNLLLNDIVNNRCSRSELEQIVEYAAGRKESNTSNIVDIILESVFADLKDGRFGTGSLTRLIVPLVKELEGELEEKPKSPINAQYLMLSNILNQLVDASLANYQLKFMVDQLTSLFRGPRLDISSKLLREPIQCLIKGGPSTKDNIEVGKALAGKVLKDLVYWMGVGEKKEPQLTTTIVCKALTSLGEHMSVGAQETQDLFGVSVIAENILDNAMQSVALEGVVNEGTENDKLAEPCVSLLVHSVVQESLACVNPLQDSKLFGKDIEPSVTKILSNIFSHSASSVDGLNPDEKQALNFSQALVADVMRNFADIISKSDASTTLTCITEGEYLWAKTVVEDVFRELALQMARYNAVEKYLTIVPGGLMEQIVMEMDEYTIATFPSSLGQNLLPHEVSHISLKSVVETMKRMARLFQHHKTSKKNSKAQEIVYESLRNMWTDYDNDNTESTTSFAKRIAREMQNQLKNSDRKQKNSVEANLPSTPHPVVINTMKDLTETLAGFVDESVASSNKCVNHETKSIIRDTFTHLTESMIPTEGESDPMDNTGIENHMIVCESLRQLIQAMLESARIVQDNIDLESSFAASHLVRQTLQHLAEAIIRSLSKYRNEETVHRNDIDALEHMALVLSESSMAIGDKQNLAERKELKKLMGIITNNLNGSQQRLSPSDTGIVFTVLEDIVDNMFSGLSKQGKQNADTLVLAGRIVNDILEQLGHAIIGHSEINITHLEKLTENWPKIFEYVATYKFKGYGVISGNIVKELLNLITSSSINGSKFCGTSQCHIVMAAVANIFNRLIFTAMSFVRVVSHWVDFEILEHISSQVSEDKLSLSDLDDLALSIISSFTISTLPVMNENSQLMMRKFLVKLMEKFREDVYNNKLSLEDLCYIGKQVEEEAFADEIAYITQQITEKSWSNEIGESRIYECLGVLLEFESKYGYAGNSKEGINPTVLIERLYAKVDSNELTKDEVMFISTGMFKVVYAMNIDECEYQFSLSSFMSIMWSVTQLNRFTTEIDDECLPYSVSIHVIHILSTVFGGNALERPDLAALKTEQCSQLIPSYRDALLQMLNRLSDTLEGKKFAKELLIMFERAIIQVPLVHVGDPFPWKDIVSLLGKVTKSIARLLGSGISTLMSFGPIRISCNPKNISNDAKLTHLYQLGVDRNDSAVCHLVTVALNALMTYADFGSQEEDVIHSPSSVVAKDLIDYALFNPRSGSSSVSSLSQRESHPHVVQAESEQSTFQVRTIVVALSKTYRELKDVLFHPSAYVRHNVGMNVRRALLDLIKDIDLQRFHIDSDEDLLSSLIKWWNDNKPTYETSPFDTDAKQALTTLVDRLKTESKIIGPPRKNEPFATVKITEQRVKTLMKRIKEDNPDLMTKISDSAYSIAANDVVETVLNALDTHLSQSSLYSSNDEAVSGIVNETVKQIQSEGYTDYIADRVTTNILENISYEKSANDSITVAKVKSFILSSEAKEIPNAPSDENLQKSSWSGLDEFVQSLLEGVKATCETKDVTEQVVETLIKDLQIDRANSETAGKMIENLIVFLKEDSIQRSISDNPLTIDTSEIARRAVDSVIRLITTNVCDEEESRRGSRVLTKQESTTEQPEITINTCSSGESDEVDHISPTSDITPSIIAVDMVESMCSHIQNDKDSEEEITEKSYTVSKIADMAVQSLVDALDSSDPEELVKMESFVKKMEEKDSDLINAISTKSDIFSPSASVTEPVVQMIIAALEKDPSLETEETTTVSATSDIAAKVVSSIIKLMNRCVSPDHSSKRPKSAQIAVQSLVDAMERDLQIAQRLKRSSGTNIDTTSNIAQQANTTIQRVKDILLRIIQDVSSNHLSTDQIEKIASSAAGEMMKTFTFEPLSNAKTSLCSSPIVNEAVKTLVKDIEDGYYNQDYSAKETSPENESEIQGPIEVSPEESMSELIKDALNYVLLDVKTKSVEAPDVLESAKNSIRQRNNRDRVQTWISSNQALESDCNLTELIAKETLRTTLTLIKDGSIPTSEIQIMAESIRQKRGNDHSDDDAVDASIVTDELNALLLAIDKKGLTGELTHTLIKTILNIVVEDTQQTAGSRCDVAVFLSKILCHLLTSSDTVDDGEISETVTERDSFIGIVTGEENKDQRPTDVKIEPTQCGQPLHVDPNVTSNALSAISIRGHSKTVNPHDPIARNSFRDLHHPDVVRTEVLSHDKPEVVEAKLEWVAQQNLHRVNTQANVDLTTIAEADPVVSCSSSSDASSIEDIDGKLENIIQISSKENISTPKPTPKASVKSQESISARSNTNTNSQKLTKMRAHRTKVAYLGNLSKKSLKVDVVASISPIRPKSKLNKVNELSRSKTMTPSGRRKINTPNFAASPLNSLHSPFPSRITQSPISSSHKYGSRTIKESTASCPAITSQRNKRMSDRVLEDDTEVKRIEEPIRVKSLCGSHSTKVTVRRLKSDDI